MGFASSNEIWRNIRMRTNSRPRDEQRRSPELGELADLPVIRDSDFVPLDDDLWEDAPDECRTTTSSGLQVDGTEQRFLETVVTHSGEPSSAYAKLARMSSKTALKARKRLIELGLLQEEKLNANARGRSVILLRPTEAARRLIEESKGETP
jgi:hypothetical protein